ncbi:prepilin peptidase [Yersinia mollaretii]|nr:A24 family peptidase [Yersinia mollaretii]MDN0111357.1 A24 family peptidase [Yersinia mollaretii]
MMLFDLTTLPPAWLLSFAALLGAILTSFGRLAVYRLPHQMGWREQPISGLTLCAPASHCDSCGQRIRFAYLLPIIGWFLAKGRCPDCGVRVSVTHPLMEAIGALGWVIALSWFGPNAEGVAACILWQVLLFLAEIDWRETWLPAVVTLPLFWAGLLVSPFEPSVAERVLGGFAGFTLMWLCMAIVGRWRRLDVLAGGDIALSAAAGAWLGFAKIPQFLFIAAAIFILMALPARTRGQLMVPMGPALAASFLLCLGLPALLY